MKIYVDADACPKAIREIIYRAGERTKTEVLMVANHFFQLPNSQFITMVQVPAGFDEADKWIVEAVMAGDLVISNDIPLADLVIQKQARVINLRGKLYDANNIKQALATRDLLSELRDNQQISGGPPPMNPSAIKLFAQQLDKVLARS
ncbi:MAG: YaiI/YqxD family protein [Neisseriaceae bacterium]|nr:MAG: YaiI/YqxD family protein [Neisseriaceae bacterium]